MPPWWVVALTAPLVVYLLEERRGAKDRAMEGRRRLEDRIERRALLEQYGINAALISGARVLPPPGAF